jgi:deoxyribodipyrimidine photolyase
MKQISERVQLLNDKSANGEGKYVLYWMQTFKRAEYNHALRFAIQQANERRLTADCYRMDKTLGQR